MHAYTSVQDSEASLIDLLGAASCLGNICSHPVSILGVSAAIYPADKPAKRNIVYKRE